MTHEEMIRTLQDQVQDHRITSWKELVNLCEGKLDPFEDVLAPIGWNTCDRCDSLGDSELDFLWLDGFDWDEGNPDDQALLKALEQEEFEHCAICWECVKELTEKGEAL